MLPSILQTSVIGKCARVFAIAAALTATVSQATPNLEGVWKLAAPQISLIPADGEIPFTETGRARYEQNKNAAAKGDYRFDLTRSRCSSPGLPRVMSAPGRLRIFQRDRLVTMMFEWNRLFRQIDLRGGPPKQLEAGTMMGISDGRWDGDTLVVESYGFRDKLLDNLVPSSAKLTVLERLRLRGRNTLENRITVTDPEIFSRPWEIVLTYRRQADEVFPEDVCLDRKDAGQMPWPH